MNSPYRSQPKVQPTKPQDTMVRRLAFLIGMTVPFSLVGVIGYQITLPSDGSMPRLMAIVILLILYSVIGAMAHFNPSATHTKWREDHPRLTWVASAWYPVSLVLLGFYGLFRLARMGYCWVRYGDGK